MRPEELLQAGIAAARSGDLDAAASYFADLVKADPSSERGWYMLGMCIPIPERRAYCMRRVLAINPNNAEARKQLDELLGALPPGPPAPAPRPAQAPAEKPLPPRPVTPAESQGASKPPLTPSYRPPQRSAPAPEDQAKPQWIRDAERRSSLKYEFKDEEGAEAEAVPEQFPELLEETQPAMSLFEEPPAPAVTPPPSIKVPPIEPPRKIAPSLRQPVVKPKKSGRAGATALVAISVVLLLACALVVVYLVLSGRLSSPLNPGYVPIPTAMVLPTSGANATAAEGGAGPTSTLAPPTALPTPLPTVSYTPTFEPADCRFDVPRGAHVTCGFLVVPEDRAGDPAHTIRLAVAVYHSTNSSPDRTPVLFLQGGPGGAAVQLAAQAYPILVAPFLKQRDFIAYDQRGTGLSEPALECPDLTKAYLQDIFGQIPADSRKIIYSNAFLSCQGQMSVSGINLNAYTTSASAADVRDLMQVLNYQQVDLYGASYGTRLAQVIMRDDPGLVHAAILDSVVPIETNFFAEYPNAIQGALKGLFADCAADAACNAAYPNLETVFWDQVDRLDANPVPITVSNPQTGTITSSVDGSVFLNVVLMSLKMSSLIGTAPQTIYRFKVGDYSTVIAAETSLPYSFQGISLGLYINMMCHEQILRTTPAELQGSVAGPADIREYAWLPFFGDAPDIYQACQSWHAAGPTLGENDPVNSNIPSLIITGKYDPTTPPKYAQLVESHLSQSYYFEFPNQGHTPTAADTSGCAINLAVAFLADPQVEPNGSCLNSLPPIAFLLPYTGDPPVAMKKVQVFGISARVPQSWPELADGFFLRVNSPFDVTQVGIFPVPGTTSADLLKWVSQKAWGYRGLDTAPVWAGQRQANGLDWTLYTSTSLGRPADMAATDHNGSSIVVLAFSSIDEHEAFYRTIFLPVVDSVRP